MKKFLSDMKHGNPNLKAKSNIYLIGFMGAGKTTVGTILAKRLNREFCDTDAMIEERLKESIAQIFKRRGETYFRKVESEIVQKVTEFESTVVSLGGGAVLLQKNWTLVQQSGVSVYLKWEHGVLISRILYDSERPLVDKLKKSLRPVELVNLLNKRRELYERADYIVNCDESMTSNQVVDRILNLVEENV